MIRLMLLWVRGMVLRRPGRLLGLTLGVGLTVSLLAALGSFLASSSATMTARAVADLPIDWQVLLNPGTDEAAIRAEIEKIARPKAMETVAYADVPSLRAQTGDSVQTTGAAKIVGFGPNYRAAFPAEIAPLLGKTDGVLIAQQTAANLHVSVGDAVSIERLAGLPPIEVRVDGVVSLPDADALFQAVGLPANAAPQAPPDNVLILPAKLWHRYFDDQAVRRPDSARVQLHVRLARGDLPTDPAAAYARAQRLSNNLEARIAGNAVVGNNLQARLDHVREDALYARVLFLFLGLPGVVLAALLTLAVAGSGASRRRAEQALLRIRGASVATVLRFTVAEAALGGVAGSVVGLGLAFVAARLLGANASLGRWTIVAALAGVVLAAVAMLFPSWRETRKSTVAATRAFIGTRPHPLWRRAWLDLVLLAIAAVELWRVASTGYQLVLAPEGVASVSIHYEAFIGPLCLWLGGVLLALRLVEVVLGRGRKFTATWLRPVAGKLAGTAAAALARQRVLLARGATLVAAAFSFAISTAVFNTTYQAQARIDAELTNGADVAITGLPANTRVALIESVRKLPGVAAAEPMQHRFAYVGRDLQDLYGIDPRTLGRATHIADAYFAGGNARATLEALARRPDGVLVSQETVTDFQLQPGDVLNLRLQRADDHQYHAVPFHFIGIAREFPTAPKDSFLVANAAYVAQQTGQPNSETILIRAKGDATELARRVRSLVGNLPGVTVSDLASAQRLIGSHLTAVNLRGLTRLELSFAVALVTAATGLIFALRLADRRRDFAILAAVGARRRHLAAFLWSEALVLFIGGGLAGALLGVGVAFALVKVLTGVFDPPPETLAIPWLYLALLFAAAFASTAAAVFAMMKLSSRSLIEELRAL